MKKILCLVLALLLMLPAGIALADGEIQPVTIVNRDRVNVRDEKGKSMGRVHCFTPVYVLEAGKDTSLVVFPREMMEFWKEEYTLSEYLSTYSGYGQGWVKNECLTVMPRDDARFYGWALECRWEMWTQGIYHKLHDDGRYTADKNHETNPIPKVDGVELEPRTSVRYWLDMQE